MASDDYTQSVGQHSTLKTAVGGAQPSHIKSDNAGDSDDLASSIAKRKAGDPNAYEREPASGDISKGSGGSTDGSTDDDDEKKPGFFGRFKVPLIVSGLLLTVVGAVLAVAKQSKDAEERDL